MEEYKLSHGLELGDAIIASTALEYNETLITGNIKPKFFKKIITTSGLGKIPLISRQNR